MTKKEKLGLAIMLVITNVLVLLQHQQPAFSSFVEETLKETMTKQQVESLPEDYEPEVQVCENGDVLVRCVAVESPQKAAVIVACSGVLFGLGCGMFLSEKK